MSEPWNPRPRRAAHRSPRNPLLVVVPILAALAVAALAIAVVTSLLGGGSSSPTPAAVSPATTHATTSPTPTPTATSPKPTSKPSPQGSKTPTHTHSPSPTVAAPQVPVVVLNQTTVPGAAAAMASDLRAHGWNVTGVGNWRGFVPVTTVYYWPGDEQAAQQLARESASVNRVMPATSPMLPGHLVVIIAN